MNQHYLLASTSPRRKELLELLGLSFSVIASNVDEVFDESIPIEDAIMELAYQKALAVFRHHKEEIVLGFDTDVVVDGVILGKPKDAEDAKRMLRMLSDKTHVVVTGGAILSKAVSTSFYEKARVTFFPMDDSEIDTYIATGEPFDKAGAYAVQGFGARYIKSIQGDFYTIMGLPVARLYHELKRLGL